MAKAVPRVNTSLTDLHELSGIGHKEIPRDSDHTFTFTHMHLKSLQVSQTGQVRDVFRFPPTVKIFAYRTPPHPIT